MQTHICSHKRDFWCGNHKSARAEWKRCILRLDRRVYPTNFAQPLRAY